jgi:hypothetical protein
MSGSLAAPLVGALICCLVPLLSFAGGVLYARRGSPVSIRFGWQRDRLDNEGEVA